MAFVFTKKIDPRSARTKAPSDFTERKAKIIPITSRGKAQRITPLIGGRPRVGQRLYAEFINRFAQFVVMSVFVVPLWMTGGSTYLLTAGLGSILLWQFCCDGAPEKPSLGKRFALLRVVSLTGEPATLMQKILRRSGTALSQFCYALCLTLSLPQCVVQTQAAGLADGLFAPLRWLDYTPQPVAQLMLLGLLIDAVGLLCISFSPQGRSLGDFFAGTRVVTKKSYQAWKATT
ncbi:MAG: hypothetical protein HOP19_20980 [Acidobacteria bacterium]|nr:hypothetical protein [Acidobacteriota bacterium]